MREDIANTAGDGVFPYSRAFLYWEEVGIIDAELVRNLVIAFAIICAIIAFLIPKPRIAVVVAINIVAAIVEVIGFAHYWGVKMNGVSTIYFLICAGLAVDYSAHVGHVFKDEAGASDDRAVQAMSRICPSVMSAIISTVLAVIVLASSQSFVFEVFFKVLFLVSFIAGAHGVWLLPTLLGIVGGSTTPTTSEGKPKADAGDAPTQPEVVTGA
jgi:predicted RND superfamily exporter protein